ncbi:protease inhibitor I42 family protein [Arthrobacter sp. AZCC_0090]|uniref:protease inhibitor I42 family protein n=1 Tax=Arthrobacter sp. AZCC_0090 TaxID=2735881 RepID=UPI00161AE7B8|nr:protease inhibitor I42 family protein [Arthrobacter sp. AZCC_0090]MBB6402977.1 inhibitor of cysteine peptidase [Arthrobacter sp. AZCC_0090]
MPVHVITVKSGELFIIELPANPSTGYQWSVVDVPHALELVEEHFTPAITGTTAAGVPAAVGSGGIHTFNFMANGTGEVEIQFDLKRVWESEAIERRKFTVLVS